MVEYILLEDIKNLKNNDRLRDEMMKLITDEVIKCHEK